MVLLVTNRESGGGSWFRGKKIPGDFEIKKQVVNNFA